MCIRDRVSTQSTWGLLICGGMKVAICAILFVIFLGAQVQPTEAVVDQQPELMRLLGVTAQYISIIAEFRGVRDAVYRRVIQPFDRNRTISYGGQCIANSSLLLFEILKLKFNLFVAHDNLLVAYAVRDIITRAPRTFASCNKFSGALGIKVMNQTGCLLATKNYGEATKNIQEALKVGPREAAKVIPQFVGSFKQAFTRCFSSKKRDESLIDIAAESTLNATRNGTITNTAAQNVTKQAPRRNWWQRFTRRG
eukprot:TRINITY_DN266_c0_g1_i1.p1 TRINITY_DN266_c0_g1~~TRINITY_DN266_c0_g1_i1.p1  ORF type:complete len:253 (-),score=70.28 TRINITY_DN266_c0_g1_i1:116-874(-)